MRTLLSFISLLALASTSAAQSQREQARRHFNEAMAAAEAERWEEALQGFEAAYDMAPRPELLLNIATARVELGRLVAGRDAYRRFIAAVPQSPHRPSAERALSTIEERIATLDVHRSAEDSVRVDGEHVAADGPISLDPGTHRIELVRGGEVVSSQEINLQEGEASRIDLQGPQPQEPDPSEGVSAEPSETEPSETRPATEPPSDAPRRGLSPGVIASIAVGAAGVVTFVVAGTLALIRHSDVESRCGGEGTCSRAEVDEVSRPILVADLGAVVGIVGGLMALVLGLLGRSGGEDDGDAPQEAARSGRVRPGPGQLGAGWEVSF